MVHLFTTFCHLFNYMYGTLVYYILSNHIYSTLVYFILSNHMYGTLVYYILSNNMYDKLVYHILKPNLMMTLSVICFEYLFSGSSGFFTMINASINYQARISLLTCIVILTESTKGLSSDLGLKMNLNYTLCQSLLAWVKRLWKGNCQPYSYKIVFIL